MSARELLAAATPRPWTTSGGERYGSVASTDPAAIEAFANRYPENGREDVEAYGGALVGESIQPSDRALIVAAVNEYEALLDLESSVRSHVIDHARSCDCALCSRLGGLDVLRADLSSVNDQGRPHSQQERAGSPDRKDDTQ